MSEPYSKFQYSVNKKVVDILNWFEKDMQNIPPVDYEGRKIRYYIDLNNNAVEVFYKSYDIKTKEYQDGDFQFSFVVDEFDDSTSVITGKFATRDIDVEKLAYKYLWNLGNVTHAEWKTEVEQYLSAQQNNIDPGVVIEGKTIQDEIVPHEDEQVRYGIDRDLSRADVKEIVKRCGGYVKRGGKVTEFWRNNNDNKYALGTLRHWLNDPRFTE